MLQERRQDNEVLRHHCESCGVLRPWINFWYSASLEDWGSWVGLARQERKFFFWTLNLAGVLCSYPVSGIFADSYENSWPAHWEGRWQQGCVPGRGWVATALESGNRYLWSFVRCECSSKILVRVFLGYWSVFVREKIWVMCWVWFHTHSTGLMFPWWELLSLCAYTLQAASVLCMAGFFFQVGFAAKCSPFWFYGMVLCHVSWVWAR